MSGTWASGWVAGDVVTAAEFKKGVGCVGDSTLLAPAASISLGSLPTTYAALLIEFCLRGSTAATTVDLHLQFNGDTGANYDYTSAIVNGWTVSTAAANVAQTQALMTSAITGSTAPASVPGIGTIWIPNYGGTTFHKAGKMNGGLRRATAAGDVLESSCFFDWRSTAAITSVLLKPVSGNFEIGSRMTAYVTGV